MKIRKLFLFVVGALLLSSCGGETTSSSPSKEEEHHYSEVYSSDETGHWHDCTVKGHNDKDEVKAHEYSDAMDTSCDICGYIRTLKHTFSKEYSFNETHHYLSCIEEGHTDIKDEEEHVFDDVMDTSCNVCDYVRVVDHTFSNKFLHDETHHWKECMEEGHTDISEKAAHTWSDWTTKSEATYTAKKVEQRDCSVCFRHEERSVGDVLPPQSRQLSVTSVDYVYDYKSKPILDSQISYTNLEGGLTIEYRKKGTGSYSSTAPSSVGTYEYRVTLKGTIEWEEKVVTGEYKITPYSLKLTTKYFDGSSIYAGNLMLHHYDLRTVLDVPNLSVWLMTPDSETFSNAGRHMIGVDKLILDNDNFALDYDGISEVEIAIYDSADFYSGVISASEESGKTTISTRIHRGSIAKNETIYAYGINKELTVTGITLVDTGRVVDKATIDDNVKITLTGATVAELKQGTILAKDNTLTAYRSATANITINSSDNGGVQLISGTTLKIYLSDINNEANVRITLPQPYTSVLPSGSSERTRIDFALPIEGLANLRFDIKTGAGNTIGTGTITSLHNHSADLSSVGTCTECDIDNYRSIELSTATSSLDTGLLTFYLGETYVIDTTLRMRAATIGGASTSTSYQFSLVDNSDFTTNLYYVYKVYNRTTGAQLTLSGGKLTISSETNIRVVLTRSGNTSPFIATRLTISLSS